MRQRRNTPGSSEPAPAAPAPRPPELVRKRDGRVVPFQRQKIADAVQKALEAAGESDPRFAAEVAGIVELTLSTPSASVPAADEPPAIPHIETIQDLVERALIELGRGAVAKAYILHRDRRARVRAALRVHRSDTLRTPVRVREREGVSDWSKGRIVAALMQEAELPREAAEDVASAVERRVFSAGKKIVTTGLLRELVASELFERGWLAALSAARAVGLARHDVRRALAGGSLHPWHASRGAARAGEELGGELLARYALESLLGESASELSRSGDLAVIGLETLGRPLALALEAELLASGGDPARAAYALLDALAELAPNVARVLVLERPAAVLAPLARTARESSPHGLTAWLRALQALASGTRVHIDLGTLGARYHAFAARLVEELVELDGSHAPRLFLDGSELEALLEERPDLAPLVERLLGSERLFSTWGSAEESFAAPGCRRLAGERGALACAGAVALNLPRIARRVGPFREELFQSALAELVQAAVEIARALRPIQVPEGPATSGLRARSSFALVPVGLREALWTLGDGTIDAELGARVLGFLGEAARRFGRESGLEPQAVPFFGQEAGVRFAYLDARAAQAAGARQEWLFDEAEAELSAARPYSAGFGLAPVAGLAAGRAEAELLRTVPVGALSFAALASAGAARTGGASGAARSEQPGLDAWRRFEVVRRAHSGELVLELFPRAPRPREERPSEPARLRPLA